jgi:hypothetical protein
MNITLNAALSPEQQILVAHAFTNCLGTPPDTISLLQGGLSGAAVYRATLQGQDYIVKLDSSGDRQSRQNAYTCATIAGAAGVGPKLYHTDPENGISISAFITPLPLRSQPPADLVTGLAKAIQQIHALPLFPKHQDMRHIADDLAAQFRQTAYLNSAFYREGIVLFEALRAAYPWQDTPKVSSHNDLNPTNILYDGQRLWILDWDAAFVNDLYTDLATAANSFAPTEELEQLLLETYFGAELNALHRSRFFLMRQMCRMIYALLFFRTAGAAIPDLLQEIPDLESFDRKAFGMLMQQGAISLATPKGQLLYGQALFHEAVMQLRSEAYEQALKALR